MKSKIPVAYYLDQFFTWLTTRTVNAPQDNGQSKRYGLKIFIAALIVSIIGYAIIKSIYSFYHL